MQKPEELLAYVVAAFEAADVAYMVTGSVASAAYGEPRYTIDIDLVANLRESQIPALAEQFPEATFYFDAQMARDAIRRRSQFNILHPESGLKVDVMVPPENEFAQEQWSRRTPAEVLPGVRCELASVEDVILNKLLYYREGRSSKHLRDIHGMLTIGGGAVDRAYIARWAERIAVADLW